MPALPILRSAAALLSLAVWAVAVYFLWTWRAGEWVRDVEGQLVLVRDTWRLWVGVAALGWALLGRLLIVPLIARSEKGAPSAERPQTDLRTSQTGSRLHVEEYGPATAPMLIFTHPWGMDASFWRYARRDLDDRFRLVMWDLPGLGRSKPGTPQRISLDAYATDLAWLIGQAAPLKPILVGHSIGGMTIQTLLRDEPSIQDRIAGVVLLNTTYTNPLRTMILHKVMERLQPLIEIGGRLTMLLNPLAWLSQWQSYLSGSAHLAQRLGFGPDVTRSQLAHSTLMATRNSPAVQAKGTLAMLHWDATGAMSNVRVPVMVIGGDIDIVTKAEAGERISDDAPAAVFHLARRANHMGPMDQAEAYNGLIAEFALGVFKTAGTGNAA